MTALTEAVITGMRSRRRARENEDFEGLPSREQLSNTRQHGQGGQPSA